MSLRSRLAADVAVNEKSNHLVKRVLLNGILTTLG